MRYKVQSHPDNWYPTIIRAWPSQSVKICLQLSLNTGDKIKTKSHNIINQCPRPMMLHITPRFFIIIYLKLSRYLKGRDKLLCLGQRGQG